MIAAFAFAFAFAFAVAFAFGGGLRWPAFGRDGDYPVWWCTQSVVYTAWVWVYT